MPENTMTTFYPIESGKSYMGRDGQVREIISFEECKVSITSGLKEDQIATYLDRTTRTKKQILRRTLSKWAIREA